MLDLDSVNSDIIITMTSTKIHFRFLLFIFHALNQVRQVICQSDQITYIIKRVDVMRNTVSYLSNHRDDPMVTLSSE